MGDFGDFIRSNATEAGGELTEEEFAAAFAGMAKQRPYPKIMLTSTATIERALADAERLFRGAGDLRLEERRTRRWRVFRRLRLLRRSAEAYAGAVALERTFRRRDGF